MKKKLMMVAAGILLVLLFLPGSFHKTPTPFSLKAIEADLPWHSEWEPRPLNLLEKQEVERALSQPWHYLSSGGQCYTFASQDDNYVLKFFKQKAFAVPSWINHYPIPFFMEWMQEKKRLKKEKRRNQVFSAFRLAFEQLFQETGLLYVHLNRTSHLNRTLGVTDATGITHVLNPDGLQFVLQRKAVVARTAIDQKMVQHDPEGAKQAIVALLQLQLSLYQKGVRNRDPNLKSNCAFIDERPLLIDVGRVVFCEEIRQPENFKKNLVKMTRRFRKYLQDCHPELLTHFDISIAKILESAS